MYLKILLIEKQKFEIDRASYIDMTVISILYFFLMLLKWIFTHINMASCISILHILQLLDSQLIKSLSNSLSFYLSSPSLTLSSVSFRKVFKKLI
jgi:hypothetical protein